MKLFTKKLVCSFLLAVSPTQLFSFDAGLIAQGLLWMTNAGIEDTSVWKTIIKLEDVTEFEGRVVAYETDCPWLTSDICITLPGKPRVNFGYIQPGIRSYVNYEGGTNAWYKMEPLLKWAWGKNTDIHNYYFTRFAVSLRMRLASKEEKEQILMMLRSERVCQFVHWSELKGEWDDEESKEQAQARLLNEKIMEDLAA